MTACRLVDEPLAGTSPRADTWWLVEDSGPWGDRAPATSRRHGVRDLASDALRRVLLVRPTVRRKDAEDRALTIWIVSGSGDLPRRHVTSHPAEIVDWPVSGDPSAQQDDETADAPTLLICTNSARDACCGIAGRELVRHLGARIGVWESSHLGGHRFAPTALQTRQGMVYGRLTPEAAIVTLDADALDPALGAFMRGSPALDPAAQVAELAVLTQWGIRGAVTATTDTTVGMDLGDGRRATVTVRPVPLNPRPVSCGAEPTAGTAWEATQVV